MNSQWTKFFYLKPEIIFLNHGSFGATPKPVFECYQYWQQELEKQPVEFIGRRAGDLLAVARADLAAYLHTDRDNLVYVTNATTAINIVARSLSQHLSPGDEVLTSDHEYGAMDRVWQFLKGKYGFDYSIVKTPLPLTDPSTYADFFWEQVSPRTKIIFLSHITSSTALLLPVQQICQKARENNIITVIDGAHAPGQIDLALDEIGADFYTGNLHKWLCAPKGSAFLYARKEVQHLLDPFIVSWGWQSDNPGVSEFVDFFEYLGTRDIAAFLATSEAIRFQQQNQWHTIRQQCHELAHEAYCRIGESFSIPPIFTGNFDDWCAQMVSVPLPDKINADLLKTQLYDTHHIEIPLTKWQHYNLLRFSFQAYNSREDIEAVNTALCELLKEYR